MKKTGSKRIIAAFLAVVMVFLMVPFGIVDSSAAADYTIPTTGHKLLSSYNVLSGTNISSDEADIKSSLDIFNRDKLDLLIANYSSYTNMHAQLGEVHEGRDMESFAASVGVSLSGSTGVNIGLEKLFKASASEKFGHELNIAYTDASDAYFYEYVVRVQKGYYNFNDAYLELIQDFSNGYLSDAFVSALTGADGSTPEEFFAKYGTHIITAYTAGGEAGVSLSSVKDSSSTDIDFSEMYEINAEASITESGITNGMSAALNLKNKVGVGIDTNGYDSNATIYAYGGTKSVAFTNNGDTTTFNYTNWADTLTNEESMVLVDERLKMIPIWNLLPSTGFENRVLDLTMHFVKESANQDTSFYKLFGIDEASFDYALDWLNFENCNIITNEDELHEIRNDLNGVYVLANNIVLSDYANWEPIGTEYEPFRGRLYGNNNTISGLNISKAFIADENEKEFIGLFGCNEGLITDLTISGNVSITGITNSNAFIGAIAGSNNGIVSNCRDNVIYDLDLDKTDYLNLPLEYISETSNQTYTIGDSLGIYLQGNESSKFSNFNIAIEESENVGPVYIVLENAHLVGNSNLGTIYNPTARPLYIISKGESNSISGGVGKPGYIGNWRRGTGTWFSA